jgi:predicted transglutaminase-like cysteine proteinase
MEAKRRTIDPGLFFDDFIPKAKERVHTIKADATLEDTLAFMPRAIRGCRGQTRALAAHLKGRSIRESCSNIWHFVYGHIQYKKDKVGYEQVRSPARAWHDRRSGVDCDCYTVFISTVLMNLGIPHLFRITKYKQDHFQHIYPVVPTDEGEIILDCVTDEFDYEVPYSEKKDYPMELQFLNGPGEDAFSVGDPGDLPVRFGDGLGDLGKIKLKGLLNKLNKFNPATILLRNGLLASMKLNLGGVANKLRWSYLTADKAKAHGITAQKLSQLMSVRKTLESIFYGAGGNLNNLKKAILKGKGNKDKAVVAGLGDLDFGDIDDMDENTPLEQLLGTEIYYSENERTFQGLEGFGSLGEPVTIASVSAASAVIIKLVTALKKIGSLFSGKKDTSDPKVTTDDGSSTDTSADTSDNSPDTTGSGGASNTKVSTKATPLRNSPMHIVTSAADPGPVSDGDGTDADTTPSGADTGSGGDGSGTDPGNGDNPAVTTPVLAAAKLPGGATGGGGDPHVKQSFWQKNKSWLKPVAIGAGGITVLVVGYHMFKSKPHGGGSSVSGVPHAGKNHHRKKKPHKKKKAVALL